MLTSFAPSPIAKVTPHYLTIHAITSLSFGEHRQQITVLNFTISYLNLLLYFYSRLLRKAPVTIPAIFPLDA
jgi:hypothetical protein